MIRFSLLASSIVVIATFGCGGRENGGNTGTGSGGSNSGNMCSCDSGAIATTLVACLGDAGGLAEGAISGDGPETEALPDGSADDNGSCVELARSCDGLQPQVLCASGQWQNIGPPCSDICRGGGCTWVCDPPCALGFLCGSDHACHSTMK